MRSLVFGAVFLALSTGALAAGKPKLKPAPKPASPPGSTKINGVTYSGKGEVAVSASNGQALPPEQSLRLKKVFLFPSIDDLSGALAPKLDEKLADLFNHNTRFELVRDPQVVKALSPDEASYYKAALSPEVHKEAAKVTGADTTVLLRTRNVGPDTRMTLELRDANGGLLFAEEGSVAGTAKMDERWKVIEGLYRGVLSRLPFEGTVTGRTAATVTVDLGVGSMRPNEVIEIARIVSIQRHPLLGTVVGTDYVRTGRARVTSVDKVLSFAEVIEEFPGEKVSPGQKVLRAQAALVHRGAGAEDEKPAPGKRGGRKSFNEEESGGEEGKKETGPLDEKERLKGDFDVPKARYGQAGASLYYGSIANDQTLNSAESSYSGSGVGGELEGELWVTKNWILHGSYTFQSATLTSETNANGGSATWDQISVMGGYRIYPEGMGEGVILTGSLGYQVTRMQIPANPALSLGGKRFSGPVVGFDGDIRFLDNQKISAGFLIQPLVSLTETGPSLGTTKGGTVIGVHLFWGRQLVDKLWMRLGLRYDVANGTYDNTTSGISEKRFAIGPGIYYLF